MPQEYRIKWKREGDARPKTRIYQRRAPAEHLSLILEGRQAEAFPDKTPDDFACCNGRECGCGGESNAEVWERRNAEFAPLEDGPRIEVRTVGEWSLESGTTPASTDRDVDEQGGAA